jgi:hypothetical protein
MKKTLKQMTDEELLELDEIGVHSANEGIKRGIMERCDKKDADWIVYRCGCYKCYGVRAVREADERAGS